MMYFRRHLHEVLAGRVSRNKVRVLLGARQTGKTALLSHLLEGEHSHFFDLQHSDVRRRFEADPGTFSREVRALPRSVRNVVVDEVQKVPQLLDELQALHDAAPAARQFFVTGSSARRLRAGSANLLPGRSHVWHLHSVCAWEVEAAEPPESLRCFHRAAVVRRARRA